MNLFKSLLEEVLLSRPPGSKECVLPLVPPLGRRLYDCQEQVTKVREYAYFKGFGWLGLFSG
jgi:hypothetical protein